jgi:uncharacterized ubiquitin-like protein YukD
VILSFSINPFSRPSPFGLCPNNLLIYGLLGFMMDTREAWPCAPMELPEGGSSRRMATIVVTILAGGGGGRDLELPGDVPLSTLAPAIAHALQIPGFSEDRSPLKAVLKFEGTEEVIHVDQTLETAGVVNGDILRLIVKEIPSDLKDREIGLRFSGPGFLHPGGRTFPFRGKSLLIGRVDRAAGVVSVVLGVDLTDLEDLSAHSVSRRHAQVLFREGRYWLQDLQSTNGTTVNGQALRPETRHSLLHGDEIQFGDVKVYFIWDSQEADNDADRALSIM